MGSDRGRMRSVMLLVAVWSTVMGAVALVPGCYGRNCEGETAAYGRVPGEGRMVAPDAWESNPIDGKWLPFPRQRSWVFEMRDLGQRTPYLPEVFISGNENPSAENGNFTLAGGNLAEVSSVGPGRMTVKNDTCADYFVRVVAHAPPNPPVVTPPIGDAGDAGP